MAKSARKPTAWKRAVALFGGKGSHKTSTRRAPNKNKNWSAGDVRMLRQLARQHAPTREIGQKLGRTEISVRGKAQREGISLRSAKPASFARRRRAR